jgi:hypothetical protein
VPLKTTLVAGAQTQGHLCGPNRADKWPESEFLTTARADHDREHVTNSGESQ